MGVNAQGLRRVREHAGLSQAQLARLADVRPATVSDIETGRHRPSLAVAQRLVHALGLTMADVWDVGGVWPGSNSSSSIARRLRFRDGLTQQQVADQAGVTVDVVSRLEAGHRILPRNAKAIALVLGASASDLLPDGDHDGVAT
jgi:transcriptional regulator with XRE-family HTH domain